MKHYPKYNPNIHHRRSIRLKGYDYSQDGLYFITICVHNMECIFGEIRNGEMTLNDAGEIAHKCWTEIPIHFPNTMLHEYVIMPNHIHGIIEFSRSNVGAKNLSPKNQNNQGITSETIENQMIDNSKSTINQSDVRENQEDNRAKDFSPLPRSPSKTIGSVVRGFKIGVTKWMRQNTDIYNIWQRDYFEHIIRNEQSFQKISEYIKNNPAEWTDDKFYKT